MSSSELHCGNCAFWHEIKCRYGNQPHLLNPSDKACHDFVANKTRVRLTAEQKVFVDEIAPKVPEPQPYGSELELFDEIAGFLRKHVLFSDDELYTAVSAWAMLSWRIEDTNVGPYLYVTAPRGHGKTVLLETLNQIVRRPLITSYATRAGVMRVINGTSATLLFDEAEYYLNPHGQHQNELPAVLNSGYRRGAYCIIIDEAVEEGPDGKKRTVRKPVAIDCFGLKVIVSRKEIFDTLEDRSIQIIMPKASKKMPRVDPAEALSLRSKLAQYRKDTLGKPLIYDFEAPEARLAEILEPLVAITPSERIQAFTNIMQREQYLRLERLRESYEFRILEALTETVEDREGESWEIPAEEITDAYNRHHGDKPTTSKSVGRVMLRLGFKKEPVKISTDESTGKRVFKRVWRIRKPELTRMTRQYGFDNDSVSCVSSVSLTMSDTLPLDSYSSNTHTHTTNDTNDTNDTKPTANKLAELAEDSF